ncbi:MAG: hypothetical protein GY711_12250 [bacterium]|nr:hypothetical protein [bacterium]
MSAELALAYHASSPSEAMIVKGFLVSEGFSAVIPGSELTDEFGSSQRMLGTMGVRVLVPQAEIEGAKEAVEAWRSAKPLSPDDAADPAQD